MYGAEHLDATTFVQRPNRIDLNQKIKFNSYKISRNSEPSKNSKNELCKCQKGMVMWITHPSLIIVLLMRLVCHNIAAIYGRLYAIFSRWPNCSAHIKKTPSILHQSKNPLEEWFLLAKGAFLLKNFSISFFFGWQIPLHKSSGDLVLRTIERCWEGSP